MIRITMHPDQEKADIALETPEDIERMHRIFSLGINCQSDRGADVEHVADVLLAAAGEIRKVAA